MIPLVLALALPRLNLDPLRPELMKWPTATVAAANREFALGYHQGAARRAWECPWAPCSPEAAELAAAREEAWARRMAWSELALALDPGLDVAERRAALRRLRGLLGPRDFEAGRMPPPAPLARLWRVE